MPKLPMFRLRAKLYVVSVSVSSLGNGLARQQRNEVACKKTEASKEMNRSLEIKPPQASSSPRIGELGPGIEPMVPSSR